MLDFEQLFAKRASQIKPGLERIAKSYEALSRPARSIPAVLIGGTNGKGSTSGFLWSLFASNAKQIGLYTSPHLVEFSERFQLSQSQISDSDIAEIWQRLKSSPFYADLSFFEIATLIAFQLFESSACAFQVLEVGLGGRWDATNVSDPLASVVVSVSQDHKEFLGDDVRSILKEKLGIMRAGRPLFWGDRGEICAVESYQSLIDDEAKRLGAPVYQRELQFKAEADRIIITLPELKALTLTLEGPMLQLPPYLKDNLALAAAVYHWCSESGARGQGWAGLETIWKTWCQGLQKAPVSLAGRAQRVREKLSNRNILVDVCHNPDGARAFKTAVQDLGYKGKFPAIVSVLKDKDFDTILDILRSVFDPVLLFSFDHERSWHKDLLDARHQDLVFYGSIEQAWQETAGFPLLAACGSVVAVGKILQQIRISPKETNLARIICGDWIIRDGKLSARPEHSFD